MNDQAFLDEIAATPDDPAPYLIYSDALQLRGDPRGDLISIQHALETADVSIAADLRRREATLIEANHDAWLGPLRDHHDELAVRWRFGFLHAARVGDVEALHALLATPATASTLAELRFGLAVDDDEDEDWASCQALVDALPWHPGFRRLHVSDVNLRGMHLAAPVTIPARAKQLDALVVQSPALALDWDTAPAKLRSLELRTAHFDTTALTRCDWPNLESLVVWTSDASGVIPALTRMPRLRHLGLCGTIRTAALAKAIVAHPVVEQLVSLDLRGGTLTTKQNALRSIAKRVKLDLRWNAKTPLTDVERLGQTYASMRSQCYETTKGDRSKFVASCPDPFWLLDGRQYMASRLKAKPKHDVLAELMGECEAALVPPGETDAWDVYYNLGEICDATADGFTAECWLWKAVNAARWANASRDEIRALGLIGTTRMRRGDPVHAAAIMDRVLAYFLAEGSKSEQAWALRQRGNVDLVRSEFAAAEGFYRRALEMYREAKDKDNESIVLSELSGVLWSRQDFEGAAAMIRDSIAMRPAGSLGLGSCYYNLGAVLNGMGRIAESEEAGRQSLAIFRKHKRRDGEGSALSLLGELAQRSNRHEEAEKMLVEALACHRERGAIRESGITLGNLARVALDRAQYTRARTLAEEAVELHRDAGNKYNEGMQLLDSADAMIGLRRLDDAAALTEEAIVPMLAINNYPSLGAAKCRRAYIAQLRGDFAAADRHYDEAIADAKQGNYPEQIGWTQMYRAVMRAQQRRTAEIAALLDEARPHLGSSIQGIHTLEIAEAVIAKLGGAKTKLPAPLGFDAHLIASLGA